MEKKGREDYFAGKKLGWRKRMRDMYMVAEKLEIVGKKFCTVDAWKRKQMKKRRGK